MGEINTLCKIGLCNEIHGFFGGINKTIEYYHKGE